jgi:hypothetical protein
MSLQRQSQPLAASRAVAVGDGLQAWHHARAQQTRVAA